MEKTKDNAEYLISRINDALDNIRKMPNCNVVEYHRKNSNDLICKQSKRLSLLECNQQYNIVLTRHVCPNCVQNYMNPKVIYILLGASLRMKDIHYMSF